MLDFILAVLAATAGGVPTQSGEASVALAPVVTEAAAPAPSVGAAPQPGVIGAGTLLEGVTDAPLADASAGTDSAMNMAVVPAGLVAEPQTPSGKFTTATEVRPILNATKGSWIAVREYNGQDLLYVTHLWGWRCGLAAMAFSINDAPMQNWPLPACHDQTATPNAILEQDGAPYLTLQLGAVQNVTIQVVYDDLSMDSARFERAEVLMP